MSAAVLQALQQRARALDEADPLAPLRLMGELIA